MAENWWGLEWCGCLYFLSLFALFVVTGTCLSSAIRVVSERWGEIEKIYITVFAWTDLGIFAHYIKQRETLQWLHRSFATRYLQSGEFRFGSVCVWNDKGENWQESNLQLKITVIWWLS